MSVATALLVIACATPSIALAATVIVLFVLSLARTADDGRDP